MIALPSRSPSHPDWLGGEFLTWLWWRAATAPAFARPDGPDVFLHVEDFLEFRGERSAARKTTLRGGAPEVSSEARAALRTGKSLTALRLVLARGEETTRATLRAPDLDVSSLRLPAPEGATARERLENLLLLQERFLDDLDRCYRTFLEVRLSPAWAEEAQRMIRFGQELSYDERGIHVGAGARDVT